MQETSRVQEPVQLVAIMHAISMQCNIRKPFE